MPSDLHCECLVPRGVEAALDGFSLLLEGVARVRDELDLDVGVTKSVRIHWNQISRLDH